MGQPYWIAQVCLSEDVVCWDLRSDFRIRMERIIKPYLLYDQTLNSSGPENLMSWTYFKYKRQYPLTWLSLASSWIRALRLSESLGVFKDPLGSIFSLLAESFQTIFKTTHWHCNSLKRTQNKFQINSLFTILIQNFTFTMSLQFFTPEFNKSSHYMEWTTLGHEWI